jgi:hypothetical protein
MMAKFGVGMKVKILPCPSEAHNDWAGQIAIITKPSVHYLGGWILDLPKHGDYDLAFAEVHLKPVYDGDEKSSWSECAWKPKELVKEK